MHKSESGPRYSPAKYNLPLAHPAFEIEPAQEYELTRMAQFVFSKLETAIWNIQTQILDPNLEIFKKVKLMTEAIKNVWPEHDGDLIKPRYTLSTTSLRPSPTITLRIEPLGEEGGIERERGSESMDGEIAIGLRKVLSATTTEELNQAVHALAEMIYHEIEHIKFRGARIDASVSGAEGSIAYLNNPGEIRSHAKQFAYKYQRYFPNKPFDIEKMRSICRTSKEINYFISFADPEKQEKYRDIADISAIYRKIVEMTTQLVPFFYSA